LRVMAAIVKGQWVSAVARRAKRIAGLETQDGKLRGMQLLNRAVDHFRVTNTRSV